jgi:hypothetical protein
MDIEPYVDDEIVMDEFESVDPISQPSVSATPAPLSTPTPIPTRSAMEPVAASSGGTAWYDLFDSQKIDGLVKSSDIMAAQEKRLADLERGITGEADDPDQEYDGPPKTGAQLGDLVRSMGLPTSIATIVDDVQDALVGTIQDLTNTSPAPPPSTGTDVKPNLSEAVPAKKSFMEILTSGNRLRGWGILMICSAFIGILVVMLFMPSMM